MIAGCPKKNAMFFAKVEKAKGCWGWTASVDRMGRGRFKWNRRTGYAPRYSWEIHRGAIPEGMYVLHTCDNPACTNPEHLFLGTLGDNARDREEKGRGADFKGEKNLTATITEREALAIIHHIKSGKGNTEISKLGFPYNAVQNIRYGRAWTYLLEVDQLKEGK